MMKITINPNLDKKKAAVVLGLYEDDPSIYSSDKQLSAELRAAASSKYFQGKFAETYYTLIESQPHFLIGLGKKKDLTLQHVRKALGKAVKCVKGKQLFSMASNIPLLASTNFSAELLGRACAEGLILGNYNFVKYLDSEKQSKKMPLLETSLQWSGDSKFNQGLDTGRIIAESTNFVKDLVNEPANVTSSTYLEKVVNKVAQNSKIRVKVMNEPELRKAGMGALLGVNAGSANPPKLIFMEYKGSASGKWQAIVGKGITFDSGGYNIKPTKYIEDMKTDMAGAAAVIGTIKAASELGIKKNLVGVMAFCENMVSSTAQRPGDIVKAYNGQTIEIGNTDAEGRLVLADALAYTEDTYQPEVMIDLATLTGACVVALGYYAAAAVSKDEALLETLKQSGESSGDPVWPLPFFEDYHNWMDGSISDLNNISTKGKGYEAGSITAGVFLSKFVKNTRWAHIDIAGSAYWVLDNEYTQKGATGSGVRVLSYYFLDS
jgi:leucyl aminopeptidase